MLAPGGCSAPVPGMLCTELGSTPPLQGTETTRAGAAAPAEKHPHIYYTGLVLVSELSVTAWWNSWWISFPNTLPIPIYFGADGHIPHPPAAPLPRCGSPRKIGVLGWGKLLHVLQGQNPVLHDQEAQIKHKIQNGLESVDD